MVVHWGTVQLGQHHPTHYLLSAYLTATISRFLGSKVNKQVHVVAMYSYNYELSNQLFYSEACLPIERWPPNTVRSKYIIYAMEILSGCIIEGDYNRQVLL